MDIKTIALILGIAAMILGGIVLFGTMNDVSSVETPVIESTNTDPTETSSTTTTTTEVETIAERTFDPDLRLMALPQEVAGFDLKESLERVDPIFPGEQYSSLVSFAPNEDISFVDEVSRVGVMLYHFDDGAQIEGALAILSLGNTLTEFNFLGFTMMEHLDEETGQLNIFWQQGPELLQILAVPPQGADSFDTDAIQAAALMVISAIAEAQS